MSSRSMNPAVAGKPRTLSVICLPGGSFNVYLPARRSWGALSAPDCTARVQHLRQSGHSETSTHADTATCGCQLRDHLKMLRHHAERCYVEQAKSLLCQHRQRRSSLEHAPGRTWIVSQRDHVT